jgi:ankyrin repeat protein
MSKDEALAELRELGFRRFDANSFILAATRGKADALRLFIAAGMPVDSQSGARTALMSAAMMGRVEAGKVLIDAGANVNQTDSTGSPPLSRLVMQCGATELLRAFIDAGADITVQLPGGTTLRQMAELSGCTENAKVLKAAGAK